MNCLENMQQDQKNFTKFQTSKIPTAMIKKLSSFFFKRVIVDCSIHLVKKQFKNDLCAL